VVLSNRDLHRREQSSTPTQGHQTILADGSFPSSAVIRPDQDLVVLGSVSFPASPTCVSLMAPEGIDLIVGDRSGHISLCTVNMLERTISKVALGRLGQSSIEAAFPVYGDKVVALSSRGEMGIFSQTSPDVWDQIFKIGTNERVARCLALSDNCLATIMANGQLGTIELKSEESLQLKRVSISGHSIKEMVQLEGAKIIALTSSGSLVTIDEPSKLPTVEVLPSDRTYRFAKLVPLSQSSFIVCGISDAALEIWDYSERKGWIRTPIQLPGAIARVLCHTRDTLVVLVDDQLFVVEKKEGNWLQTKLEEGCQVTEATAIDGRGFVTGGFRGSVTVWRRTEANMWEKKELQPHAAMVTVVSNSPVYGLLTGSYDHSLRWWGTVYAKE